MAPIADEALPQVAADFMNEDHAEEVRLANVLETLLESEPSDHAGIDAALDALVLHTQEHFTREEEAMRASSFPAYPVHKGEHERVLGIVGQAVQAWKDTRDADALARWIREELAAWLVEHIATMDTVTAQFIAARGF